MLWLSAWSMRKSHHHSFLSLSNKWLNKLITPNNTWENKGRGQCVYCFVLWMKESSSLQGMLRVIYKISSEGSQQATGYSNISYFQGITLARDTEFTVTNSHLTKWNKSDQEEISKSRMTYWNILRGRKRKTKSRKTTEKACLERYRKNQERVESQKL